MTKKTSKARTKKIRLFILLILMAVLMYGFIWRPLYLYKKPFELFDYCAYGITINDDFAYITHNKDVKIYPISGNTFFAKRSKIKTDDAVFGINVVDNIAYFVGENALLTIYDVTDPYTPKLLCKFKPNLASAGILVEDDIAYVTTFNGEINIIDVSNPSEPIIVSELNYNSYTRAIKRYKEYLYVGDPQQGLIIYDVSDVTNPQEIYTVSGVYGSHSIYIHKNTLYLCCHSYGVKVFDITDPSMPKLISSFYDSGEYTSITVNDQYIFVGNMKEGIEIWENLTTPKLLYKDTKFTTYIPHSLALFDDYLLLADQDSGFVMVDWTKLVD